MKDRVLFVLIIALVICGLALISVIVLSFKNTNTAKNHIKILNAIMDYQNDCVQKNMFKEARDVSFEDKEDYNNTFWRLWDWGYTRILPKDKFEIIKPYIK